jgi:hypothetical protein
MNVKFFAKNYQDELAKAVSEFIRDKKVINISYSIATREVRGISCGFSVEQNTQHYMHCCCVMYEDKNKEEE